MSEIPEGYDAAEWTLAEKLAKADGFVSLWAPTKEYRNWFIRLARAILAERAAERERCANHLMLTVNAPAEALRLEYGELTAQEVRTIRAVLTQQASSIRSSHE